MTTLDKFLLFCFVMTFVALIMVVMFAIGFRASFIRNKTLANTITDQKLNVEKEMDRLREVNLDILRFLSLIKDDIGDERADRLVRRHKGLPEDGDVS